MQGRSGVPPQGANTVRSCCAVSFDVLVTDPPGPLPPPIPQRLSEARSGP